MSALAAYRIPHVSAPSSLGGSGHMRIPQAARADIRSPAISPLAGQKPRPRQTPADRSQILSLGTCVEAGIRGFGLKAYVQRGYVRRCPAECDWRRKGIASNLRMSTTDSAGIRPDAGEIAAERLLWTKRHAARILLASFVRSLKLCQLGSSDGRGIRDVRKYREDKIKKTTRCNNLLV